MQYFSISYDTESGGVFPQLATSSLFGSMVTAWDWPAPISMERFSLELEDGAKTTDILSQASSAAYGFVVSSNVKELLQEFNVMKHRYYPCVVQANASKLEQFQWLHLFDPELAHGLDYSKSQFVEEEWLDEVGPINIKSFEHYQALKSKDTEASFGVTLREVCFLDGVTALDMFAILPFTESVLVSERLRDAFLKHGLIGATFDEAPEVHWGKGDA